MKMRTTNKEEEEAAENNNQRTMRAGKKVSPNSRGQIIKRPFLAEEKKTGTKTADTVHIQ